MRERSKSWASIGSVGCKRVAIAATAALLAGLVWWGGGAKLVWRSEVAPIETRAAVQIRPRSASERNAVLALAVDVWSEYESADRPLTVVMLAHDIAKLKEARIPFEIVVDDIDLEATAERQRIESRVRTTDGGGWFNEYRDIGEVAAFMDGLGEQYPGRAKIKRFGTSLEGWPMRAIEIGRGDINIVLNGGQHAREWISVMVPLCIAERLLRRDPIDPRVREVLDAVTFHIAPLANPDGYAHSWSVDRYWRKNRRGGHGVDLNRNYSVAWGKRGSSSRKRSQTYRGTSAFSEPESRAMRSLFEAQDVAAHLDFHSYSQLILYPWMYGREDPPDRDKFAALADRMSSAMAAEHGVNYKIMPGVELYGASGTLADWAYGESGSLSFVVELRPARGSSGFVLPPDQIIPTCDESFAAATELAEWTIVHR